MLLAFSLRVVVLFGPVLERSDLRLLAPRDSVEPARQLPPNPNPIALVSATLYSMTLIVFTLDVADGVEQRLLLLLKLVLLAHGLVVPPTHILGCRCASRLSRCCTHVPRQNLRVAQRPRARLARAFLCCAFDALLAVWRKAILNGCLRVRTNCKVAQHLFTLGNLDLFGALQNSF